MWDDRGTVILRASPVGLALLLMRCPPPTTPPYHDPREDVPWTHPPTDRPPSDRRLRVYVSESIGGTGLPCKLSVRGVGGTPDPSWGQDDQRGVWIDPDNRALAIGHWVLMARGRAEFMLTPGRYRFSVTRGPEYAPLSLGEVDTTNGEGVVRTGELRRVVHTEGEIAGEFHVHSAPSGDSDVPLDERVLSLAAEGIEVFASTDHDVAEDFMPAVRSLGLERHLHWIRGDEITADGMGHFNVFPLPVEIDPTTRLRHTEPTVAEIIASARAVAPSSIIQLNHPMWRQHPIGYWLVAGFDPATGMSRMDLATMFDTVEVWNGHTLDETEGVGLPVSAVIDAWMTTLQIGRGATATGNSDSHRLSHTPPGWPRTMVRVARDVPAEVTDAMVIAGLRAGDALVTSGPFVQATIDGRRAGELVRARNGAATLTVEVQSITEAPIERVTVTVNRTEVGTFEVTARPEEGVLRQRWEVPLRFTRDAWVVVRTRARETLGDIAGTHARPMDSLALTNPIYVDVDGDGRWTAPGVGNGP